MTELIKKENVISNYTLDDGLKWLTKYGKPKLSQMDKGTWWARIEMNVLSEGASFEVKSNSSCESPYVAVNQLIDRVSSAIDKLTTK